MAPQFFGREVQVTVSDEVKVPTAFRLDDREYVIADIIAAWPDYGFGPTAPFEIYYDRGTSLKHPERRKWILHRQL